MPRVSNKQVTREQLRAARLEVIRQRHKKLILEPRETIAADLDDEFSDPFEEFGEPDELQFVEAPGMGRF